VVLAINSFHCLGHFKNVCDDDGDDLCCRDFTISYLATDDTGEDVYLSLLSDWDLDAAFLSASNPCLRLKVDLKPFEPGMTPLYYDSSVLFSFSYMCHGCTVVMMWFKYSLFVLVDLLHCESEKTRHLTLAHNFTKY